MKWLHVWGVYFLNTCEYARSNGPIKKSVPVTKLWLRNVVFCQNEMILLICCVAIILVLIFGTVIMFIRYHFNNMRDYNTTNCFAYAQSDKTSPKRSWVELPIHWKWYQQTWKCPWTICKLWVCVVSRFDTMFQVDGPLSMFTETAITYRAVQCDFSSIG